MRWRHLSYLRWVILTSVAAGAVASLLLGGSGSEALVVVLTVLLALVTGLLWSGESEPLVLWDGDLGVLALIRRWSVEVQSGRLLTSVPLGIDLSRSAVRVLRAVHPRLIDGPDASLRFFVIRPLSESSTIVGFVVVRRALRLFNGVGRVTSLYEEVASDAAVLESALHGAYPHTPVRRAELPDLLSVASGGVHQVVTH